MNYNYYEQPSFNGVVKPKIMSIVWSFIFCFAAGAIAMYIYLKKTSANGVNKGHIALILGLVLLMFFTLLIYNSGVTIHYDNDGFTARVLFIGKTRYRYLDIMSVETVNNRGYLVNNLLMSNGKMVPLNMKLIGAKAFMNVVTDHLNTRGHRGYR